MHRLSLALPLLPVVLAQYGSNYGGSYGSGSSSGSGSSNSGSAANEPSADIEGVHVVKVGQNGLTFEPAEVQASVGDVVEFHFWPKAHSVAQSSFDDPCRPLNTTGFFSGPVKVESGMGDQVFRVTVEDEKPMWYYCATGAHCQNGMVGVINAPSNGRTLQQYADAASDAETEAPSQTGGGVLVDATAPHSSTPTPEKPNAGIQMRGDVRWGLMSAGIAMVGFVGGFML